MKKLLMLIAAFSFAAATATFAQSADEQAAKQEPVKTAVASDKSDMPKACCKSGSGKSCSKSSASSKACAGSTAHSGSGKSCNHDHAKTETVPSSDKVSTETAQPTAIEADQVATPKK